MSHHHEYDSEVCYLQVGNYSLDDFVLPQVVVEGPGATFLRQKYPSSTPKFLL